MASELQANDEWERVAAELRAYREAQEQAWGEIDNATLGRFIADDLDTNERRQIERALNERPELRKLTDLVRDVLAEFEPAAGRVPAPRVPAPTPRILPFPRKQLHKPSVVGWVKKRAGMLAAACLLLALSSSLLDSRLGNALLGEGPPAGNGTERSALAMSRTGQQPFLIQANKPHEPVAAVTGTVATARLTPPSAAGLNRLALLNRQIDGYERQGKWQLALDLDEKAVTVAHRANLEQHPEFAANRERVAVVSEKQGDLGRAYQSLNQAYEIRKKEQGLDSKDTAKTAQALANVYAVALNSSGPATFHASSMAKISTPNTLVPAPAPPAQPAMVMVPRGGPLAAAPHGVRQNAMQLHEWIENQDAAVVQQKVVPVMLQGLENAATEAEREQFVRAIGNLGPNAAPAAPFLVARLQRAQVDDDLKKNAPGTAPAAVHRGNEGLTNRERRTTLWALGRMGPEAREAVPVMVEALNSHDPDVSRAAADALVQVGPPAQESLNLYLKQDVKDVVRRDEMKAKVQIVLKRLEESDRAKRTLNPVRRDVLGIVTGSTATRGPWPPNAVRD